MSLKVTTKIVAKTIGILNYLTNHDSLQENVPRFVHQYSDIVKNAMFCLITILSFALWFVASCHKMIGKLQYHVLRHLQASQAERNLLFLFVIVST